MPTLIYLTPDDDRSEVVLWTPARKRIARVFNMSPDGKEIKVAAAMLYTSKSGARRGIRSLKRAFPDADLSDCEVARVTRLYGFISHPCAAGITFFLNGCFSDDLKEWVFDGIIRATPAPSPTGAN